MEQVGVVVQCLSSCVYSRAGSSGHIWCVMYAWGRLGEPEHALDCLGDGQVGDREVGLVLLPEAGEVPLPDGGRARTERCSATIAAMFINSATRTAGK
jgi:hypothetical protein